MIWLSTNAVEVLVNEAKKSMSDLVICGYVREFSNRSKEKNFDYQKKLFMKRIKYIFFIENYLVH